MTEYVAIKNSSGGGGLGYSGYSGIGGYSGYSGATGSQGVSGYSGISGLSGFSGAVGTSGFSGVSGYSGYSGRSGFSGYSGRSGYSGSQGNQGITGTSGYSGYSGTSGYSGCSGRSGFSGFSGAQGPVGFRGPYGGNSVSWTYNGGASDTTVDPGDTYFCLDHPDPNQASSIGLSFYDINYIDVASWSGTIAIGGTIRLFNPADSNEYWIYQIGVPPGLGAGVTCLGLSLIGGNAAITSLSGSEYVVSYTAPGDAGSNGTSGFSGRSGYSGYSGYSGRSGYSGATGSNGTSGFSGYSGALGGSLRSFSMTIGAGGVISTGSKGFYCVPTNGTITKVVMLADQSGSAVIDIKKSTYSGFPSTSSICASAKPTLSAAQKSTDSTLSGWTTSFSSGDVFEFVVDSASTITQTTITVFYSA